MSRVQQLEQHVHSHNLWLQHLARQQEEPSQPLPRHERLPTSTYLPEHSAASAPPTERRSHHRSPSPYAAHPVYSSSTRSPPEARGARWSAAATIEVTSSRSLPYSTRTPTMAEYDRPPPRTERSERALNSPPPPLPSRTTVRPSYGGLEPLPHTEGHPHTPSYAYDSDDRATYRSAYQPEEWHRSVSRLQDLDNPRPSKRHRASMDEEHLGAGMPASAEYTRSGESLRIDRERIHHLTFRTLY